MRVHASACTGRHLTPTAEREMRSGGELTNQQGRQRLHPCKPPSDPAVQRRT